MFDTGLALSWITLFGTAMVGVLFGFAYGIGYGRALERRKIAKGK